MSEEPQTPKEMAEHKVAMAVRDCWLAMGELLKLRKDPIARPIVADHEVDLWSIQTQCIFLLAEIEEMRAPKPKLKVVSNG